MRKLIGRSVLSLIVLASPAAAAVRTFVSVNGVDNATCDRISPCRTLNAAILAVDTGGEVVALDTGGYGPATINKSVAIIAPRGVHAAIAPTSGDALTVNTGGRVTINGWFLNNQGGQNGIRVVNAGGLSITDCEVVGFGNINLWVNGNAHLSVKDSVFRDAGVQGVYLQPVFGTNVKGTFSRCGFERNGGAGLSALGGASRTVRVTVGNSVIAGNGGHGVASDTAGATLNVVLCQVVENNGSGVGAFQGGTTRVSGSMVIGNQYGLHSPLASGSLLQSFNNNQVRGNTLNDLEGDINGQGQN